MADGQAQNGAAAGDGGTASRSVVASASDGFVSLFSASLVAKVITFGSTVVVARSVGRAALGVGTLQLDELLFLGPLVMTRDGLRKVAYRVNDDSKEAAQSLVNLCWLSAPVMLLLGLVGARSLWHNRPAGDAAGDASFARASACTLLALALAAAHEPAFLLAQSRMDQRFRARAETLAVLAKCGGTVLGALALALGAEAFALGNLGYAATLLVLYVGDFRRHGAAVGASMWPRRLPNGDFSETRTFGPAKEFWVQSFQKWVLENGEKVVMVVLGTDEQAGEYALVSNLGSIVARLLFQPLEEMALATFGKLQAIAADGAADEKRGRQALHTMRQAFSVLLRLLVILGLLFACFGPAYAHLLLRLLYGTTWSETSAPGVLSWYCTYILAMAVNGLCEAFVQGVATQEQLRTYNYWMVLFSATFIGAVVLLMPYGAIGMVVANVLKMACRIAVCVVAYIRPAFQETGQAAALRSALPAPSVCAAFAGAFAATQASSAFVYSRGAGFTWLAAAKHVAVGVICLGVVAVAAWRCHGWQLLRDVRELRG